MHGIIETPAYLSSAKAAGMTDAEMKVAVDTVAGDPLAGDLIVGSGGCRKVRIAGRGKGKSGGYRIVTFYVNERTHVFLLAVLSKGSQGDFSPAQVKIMSKVVAQIKEENARNTTAVA
jgi:hypothetical protein